MNSLVIYKKNDVLKSVAREVVKNFIKIDIKAEMKETALGFKSLGLAGMNIAKKIPQLFKESSNQQSFKVSMAGLNTARLNIVHSSRYFSETLANDLSEMSVQERSVYFAKITAIVLSVAAGGYVGSTLPDKDITYLGIGKHRNAVFHSVISAFVARLFLRLMERFCTEAQKHNLLTENDLAVATYCLKSARCGVALGVAAHLIVDGTAEGSKAVLFTDGSLVSNTLIDDRAWLLVNGFVALFLGKKDFEASFTAT